MPSLTEMKSQLIQGKTQITKKIKKIIPRETRVKQHQKTRPRRAKKREMSH